MAERPYVIFYNLPGRSESTLLCLTYATSLVKAANKVGINITDFVGERRYPARHMWGCSKKPGKPVQYRVPGTTVVSFFAGGFNFHVRRANDHELEAAQESAVEKVLDMAEQSMTENPHQEFKRKQEKAAIELVRRMFAEA